MLLTAYAPKRPLGDGQSLDQVELVNVGDVDEFSDGSGGIRLKIHILPTKWSGDVILLPHDHRLIPPRG